MHRRLLAPLALALLPAQAAPPSYVEEGFAASANGQYLAASKAFARAAFAPDGTVRDEMAFQMWSQAEPMVTGELPLDTFFRRKPRPTPDASLATQVAAASTRPAIEEIVRRARLTSIVILNEDHTSPRARAFGWQVARALRPLGYAVLAAETFDNDPGPGQQRADDKLVRDGFVRRATGAYTQDPVFAAFVRQALAIGYRPLAYEATAAQQPPTNAGPPSREASIAARESAQAANLIAGMFRPAPATKVLIYVGDSHVAEAPLPDGDGKPTEWMAARLKLQTGIDPLTIDQTTLTDTAPSARAAYAIAAAKAGSEDGVLFVGNQPKVVGYFAAAVDLQVVHPVRRYVNARPAWLASLGGRPVAIPTRLLPRSGERLIQAFAALAPDDAVPLDQVLVTAGKPVPKLYVPPGPIRFATQP